MLATVNEDKFLLRKALITLVKFRPCLGGMLVTVYKARLHHVKHIFHSVSNCCTHFYIQQDNIKKLTKKTYKNKQQHKSKTLVTFENDKT